MEGKPRIHDPEPEVFVGGIPSASKNPAVEFDPATEVSWTPAFTPEVAVASDDEDQESLHPCTGETELFFPPVGERPEAKVMRVRTAQSICRNCEERSECLSGALARREPWGVWGGEDFWDGNIVVPKKSKKPKPKQNETPAA